MAGEYAIDIRLVDLADAALLELEKNNRYFFQKYTPLKKEEFYTLQGQIDRIKKSISNASQDAGYTFGILLKDAGALIGVVSLTEVVRGDLQSCWIGYCLDKNNNGKGYMTQAVRLAVGYGFGKLKLHRIEAGVMPHNRASIRVLEKAGFHKEGIGRQNVRINGKWEDHQTLAIINNE
ncbi:GNAT family N-acetyltransferase [Peribacillus sp. SCS-155]|uniref:GNAT family N-acetyltransferase n=1 Tax=Peribacillus sedimenti TaxID=3115297 RepID=UPI0039057617